MSKYSTVIGKLSLCNMCNLQCGYITTHRWPMHSPMCIVWHYLHYDCVSTWFSCYCLCLHAAPGSRGRDIERERERVAHARTTHTRLNNHQPLAAPPPLKACSAEAQPVPALPCAAFAAATGGEKLHFSCRYYFNRAHLHATHRQGGRILLLKVETVF